MEGSFTIKKLVDDDAERPDIDFKVIIFMVEDFRSDIKRSAFHRINKGSGGWQFFGKSKITDFYHPIFYQYILRLKVSVNDIVLVEVGEGLENLPADFLNVLIREFFFVLKDLAQIRFCILGNNDDIMLGFDHFQ